MHLTKWNIIRSLWFVISFNIIYFAGYERADILLAGILGALLFSVYGGLWMAANEER